MRPTLLSFYGYSGCWPRCENGVSVSQRRVSGSQRSSSVLEAASQTQTREREARHRSSLWCAKLPRSCTAEWPPRASSSLRD
eukprot:3304182-Rhodomonas_salina.1